MVEKSSQNCPKSIKNVDFISLEGLLHPSSSVVENQAKSSRYSKSTSLPGSVANFVSRFVGSIIQKHPKSSIYQVHPLPSSLSWLNHPGHSSQRVCAGKIFDFNSTFPSGRLIRKNYQHIFKYGNSWYRFFFICHFCLFISLTYATTLKNPQILVLYSVDLFYICHFSFVVFCLLCNLYICAILSSVYPNCNGEHSGVLTRHLFRFFYMLQLRRSARNHCPTMTFSQLAVPNPRFWSMVAHHNQESPK